MDKLNGEFLILIIFFFVLICIFFVHESSNKTKVDEFSIQGKALRDCTKRYNSGYFEHDGVLYDCDDFAVKE